MKPAGKSIAAESSGKARHRAGRQPVPQLLAIGYLRADSDELAAPLEGAIRAYAARRSYVLTDLRRDAVGDDEVGRSEFWHCMASLYRGEVQVIVIPTWDHLARGELRRRTMLAGVHSAGGLVDLVDAREPRRPSWSVAPAADPALAPAAQRSY